MRKKMATTWWTTVALLMATIVFAAPPDKVALRVSAERSLPSLREQIVSVMQEREDVLRELNSRYAQAALADRVALEAEAAQLQEEYERQYLELVIEYHRLSGNAEELARAERMLEALNSPTQLPPDKNLTIETPAVDQPKEGVVRDER